MAKGFEITRRIGEIIIGYGERENYLENPGKIIIARVRIAAGCSSASFHVSGNYKIMRYGAPNEISFFQRTGERRRLEKVVKEVMAKQPEPLPISMSADECLVAYRPEEDAKKNPDNVFLLIVGKKEEQDDPYVGIQLWGAEYEFMKSNLLRQEDPQEQAIREAMLKRISEMDIKGEIRF